MMRATGFKRAGDYDGTPFDVVVLAHDERQLRRKLLVLQHGDEVMVDFSAPVTFDSGDVLVLEDGRLAEVIAGEEELYEIHGRDETHLMELCWHLGNRHLPCQVDRRVAPGRLLILRDHVIRDMLIGLGAEVRVISEPFVPVRGAYHAAPHGHSHDHGHEHGHSHSHSHSHGHHHHHE